MYIAFEGPGGCGKTSIHIKLKEYLKCKGLPVVSTREPGGTEVGSKIRQILLDSPKMHHQPVPRAEVLLFSADRAQLVEVLIRKKLEEGNIVLTDRTFYTTLAYQGYAHGLNQEELRFITNFAVGDIKPNIVYFLDLPIEIGLERRRGEDYVNRIDKMGMDFHKRARRGYYKLVKQDPR